MPVSYWIFKNSPEEVVTLSLNAKSEAEPMRTGSAPPFLMFYCFTRAGPRLAAPAKSAKRLLSVGREGPHAPRARAGVPSTPNDVAAPRDDCSEPTSRA